MRRHGHGVFVSFSPLDEGRECEGGITGKSGRRCGVEDSDDEMGRCLADGSCSASSVNNTLLIRTSTHAIFSRCGSRTHQKSQQCFSVFLKQSSSFLVGHDECAVILAFILA